MLNRYTLTPLAYAALAVFNPAVAQLADPEPTLRQNLPAVVVTAPQMSAPLTIVTDPRAPRQPIPAHDGADYLKTIPGFSVVRKGGTDGDPVLRGMAGSRLSILMDGQQILGGCGGRMDPPTAYIYPSSYDSVTVIKGPQTVLYGAGNSAGTVLFERSTKRRAPGIHFDSSVLGGSYGRNDQLADFGYYTEDGYVRAIMTRSHMDDYRDGNGSAVHSAYTRWSGNVALGWTPDDNTLLELSLGHSDGQAAYADRGVYGAMFRRNNINLRFDKRHISPLIKKIEAQVYRNHIDHVMDNYSLRRAATMARASNPDRTTEGARVAVTLALSARDQLVTGIDMQRNAHTGRSSMRSDAIQYQNKARVTDARFRNVGLFGELTHALDAAQRQRLITGLRIDQWHGQDLRAASVAAGTVLQRDATLTSGFARYERDMLDLPMTLYAGLGHTQRFPDYWELVSKQSADSRSAFGIKPEKTTQLDLGALYRHGRLNATASAFYNRIDDYIQIQSGVLKATTSVTVADNIDADTWGGEFGASYALSQRWTVDGSLAYVRGHNRTAHTALAQMPALETRFALNYDDQVWSFGSLLRVVAAQHRFDVNKGTIAGQDIGSSAGFTVFSLNGGWKPKKGMLLSLGIDNLFNKNYAEHLSRSGPMLAGYSQTSRINEPGRTLWLKAQFTL